MDFVLVDQSGGAPTADGSTLTPPVLADIAAAIEIQLNRDAGPYFPGVGHRVRPAGDPTDIDTGEHVHAIQPALEGVPNAIAYHSRDGQGNPFSLDAITLSDTLTGRGNSLSTATSHELLEILGDPGINRWAKDGKGSQVAIEACDAVEQQSYPIALANGHTVYVSNFLLPAFFDPGAPPPYDFLSTIGPNPEAPPAPFQTAPASGGNYQIVEDAGTGDHQVTAFARRRPPHVEGTPTKLEKRRHWSSRTYKRGVRL